MAIEWVTTALAALTAGATGGGAWVWLARRRGGRSASPARSTAAPDRRQSVHDQAGRAERAAFEHALEALVEAGDQADGAVSVLCIGIEQFHLLNETYGHEAGDGVLQEIGRRIAAAGGSRAATARSGGTEFLLAVPGGIDVARALAGRLLDQLGEAIDVEPHKGLRVGSSIGIACYPAHGARPLLVANATMAMRAVRQAGGGSHAEFQIQMRDDQREQAALARDLSLAIQRNQLVLYYQPKIDAVSLQVTAAEALLRWQHPTRGLVSPAVFIPIAERHGLIGSIGNWVLEEATRQAAKWRDRGLRMRVAINVSGYQMRQDDFIDRLEQALAHHRLQPGRFTCEITETVAMEDTAVTQRAFARLGRLGVHVSIDDFGTGHSSLALLRRLPAAELKIDRAFVTDLGRSADALAVARAIVQLAHSLDLRVVAEGVETVDQRDHLLALGCDELQGFLFARPMSATALALWAMDDHARPTPAEFRASLFEATQPAPL